MGVLAYAFQIYFDFCGYSDMAVGLGRMLGFEFLKNFDAPYRAESITELWRRWHISLSSVLRDYLYLPLGGNRKGPARTYVNLGIVMLLGGIMARSQMDLHRLGRLSWGAPVRRTMAGQTEPLPFVAAAVAHRPYVPPGALLLGLVPGQ